MAVTVFNRGAMAAASGSLVLFSDFEDDGPMWTGKGPREARSTVDFGLTFVEPPIVHVGLRMWDASHASNLRMEVNAEEVEDRTAVIVFRTWGDSRIARIAVSWLAIGMVYDPDLWDL